jgi:hypothetical protein
MKTTRMKRGMAAALLLALGGGRGLFAEEPVFSGVFDNRLVFEGGAGEAPPFSYGFEGFLNLRLRAAAGDRGTFYGALNLIALSGTSLESAAALAAAAPWGNSPSSPLVSGENYAAAVELERLYFSVKGDNLDWDAGLLRLAFGYGQVFSPMDFLNPRNPLFPDARPRAVLGTALAAYPAEETRVQVFAAAPRDPFIPGGGGFRFGGSAGRHWDRASLQALYAFETPGGASSGAVHRGGLSLKADWKAAFTADLLYTWEQGERPDIDGLSTGAGFDCSLGKGAFSILAEYLFSGLSSVSAANAGNLLGFSHRNYLYGSVLYRFNDYAGVSAALLFGADDISFTPILSAQYELFQGITLGLNCRFPLDRNVFTGKGEKGELGPVPPGTDRGRRFTVNASARVRF